MVMDKIKIARSFSRSAATYDQVAYLQRDVGLYLIELLKKLTISDQEKNHFFVDLGCGTGFFAKQLQSIFSTSDYIGIDLAEGMLRYSKDHYQEKTDSNNPLKTPLLICADAEYLPLADSSIDCIFSNMAVQWCENISHLFAEAYRVLSPGGLFVLTTLGPKTLYELKNAWATVDDLVHVNDFYPPSDWQQAMEMNHFSIDHYENKKTVLKYESVLTLLKELKLLGAHNVNDGQRKTLTGPKRLKKLLASYPMIDETHYPATYDVDYWVIKKPKANA